MNTYPTARAESVDAPYPSGTTSPTLLCGFCGAQFTSEELLARHLRTDHAGRPYPPVCEICGEKFESPADLQAHHRSIHRSGG